jgi:phosphatidylglycerol:prolipoprotein diacylglycerol transferase
VHPWLFRLDVAALGPVVAPTYFALILLACVSGTEAALRQNAGGTVPPRRILMLSGAAILAGLLGARLASLLFVELGALSADPLGTLLGMQGGMVWYGGLLGGLTALLGLAHRWSLPALQVGDAFAAPAMLGLSIGRLGCFAAGCCYGRPIDWGTGIEWPWGVTFLQGQVPVLLRGFPLHPTQLYSSANALVIFVLVTRLRRRQAFDGQAMGATLVAYGITRSLLELLRLDVERGFLLESVLGRAVSTSQAISIPLVATGLVILLRGRRSAVAV